MLLKSFESSACPLQARHKRNKTIVDEVILDWIRFQSSFYIPYLSRSSLRRLIFPFSHQREPKSSRRSCDDARALAEQEPTPFSVLARARPRFDPNFRKRDTTMKDVGRIFFLAIGPDSFVVLRLSVIACYLLVIDYFCQIVMSDETAKAQSAKPTEDTIFGKIIRKEIPVDLLHDDDQVRSDCCLERRIDFDCLCGSVLPFMTSVNKRQRTFWLFPRKRFNSSLTVQRHRNKYVILLGFDCPINRFYLETVNKIWFNQVRSQRIRWHGLVL